MVLQLFGDKSFWHKIGLSQGSIPIPSLGAGWSWGQCIYHMDPYQTKFHPNWFCASVVTVCGVRIEPTQDFGQRDTYFPSSGKAFIQTNKQNVNE